MTRLIVLVRRLSGSVSTWLRVVALSWLAVLAACSGSNVEEAGQETGYEISRHQRDSVFWVDNTRLVFAGMHSTELREAIRAKEANPGRRLTKLFVWDDTTRTVRLHADAQSACFSMGTIKYTVHLDEALQRRTTREGPFGSERESDQAIPVLTDAEGQDYVSGLGCKSLKRSELLPPAARYRDVVVLHDGHGYLDFGPSGGLHYLEERSAQPKNLTLFTGQTGQAIKLPMTWDEDFAPAETTYSSFRGAYVLHPRPPEPRSPNEGNALKAYLLWPDGRVETTSIPYSPAQYLIDPQPTKTGWIFGGVGDFYKSNGLYLFSAGTVSKLDVGAVHKIAVSPDGCKAAVGIQNKHLEMGAPFNIKVFDLCKDKR